MRPEPAPFDKIIEHLREHRVPYEEVSHKPVGRTEEYRSALGTRLEQQVKCLLVRVKGGGTDEYLLAAIPASKQLDFEKVKVATGMKRAGLADKSKLKELTNCDFGELPPIASIFGLRLLFDEDLLSEERVYFNAGRLDRSLIVSPEDLVRIEKPIMI